MTNGYNPVSRGTILIPSGSKDHLHFVCSDPVFYPPTQKESVLVVNISSIKDDIGYDSSCVLDVGDHPFITHPSFVYYLKADIFGADNIARNVADGTFQVHEDCTDETFVRILDGFDISDDVRPKPFRFYEKHCKKKE
ncbi:hypothetical protein [Shewanella japonica]|uniref:hypothetical protein n=1 Tax=Shewanella TaxID=22 RepID=UPI002494657B|nr:hypothetical protein [Shewanella japonica]